MFTNQQTQKKYANIETPNGLLKRSNEVTKKVTNINFRMDAMKDHVECAKT